MKYVLIFSALIILTSGRTIEPIVFSQDGYVCTSSGSFSDPDDSSKFYYCVAAGSGYISALISCSSGYIFDNVSAQCVLVSQDQTLNATTAVSEAADVQTTVIASRAPLTASPTPPSQASTEDVATTSVAENASTELPTSPSVAASFSTEAVSSTTEIASAATDANSDVTTVTPFSCTGSGSFPDPTSQQIYYYCFSVGDGVYVPVKLECGTGTQYIARIGSCGIPGDEVPTSDSPASTLEPETFKCPGAGIFANPDDSTTFYYCLADGDGSYIPFELTCGSGTQFLPTLGGCGLSADTDATTEVNTGFNCPGIGSFSNPNSNNSFYFCFTNGEGGYIPTLLTCSSGMDFDADLDQCVDSDGSPDISSTVAPFTCPSDGVFADPIDTTKFYYCIENPDGSGYRETVFTCPLGLVYNDNKKYCSTPEVTVSTTELASTTDISTPGPYNCSRIGMFADPSNNEYFFVCIFDGFGYIAISMECSPGLVFIQDLYRCASADTPVPAPSPVDCKSIGYYADPTDCQTYYYCYSNFDGGYLSIQMECPDGTSFFPNLQICVNDSVYSCNNESSSEPDTATDEETSTTNEVASTTVLPASTTTAQTTEFQCTTSGNFPYPGNPRRYYECKVLQNGRIFVKIQNCWLGEQFSTELHKCAFSFNWNGWW